ncbi:hypothetical protein ANN_13798 [Periplaneta americana]|uniref:Uncharacterized protein n=1 Tax=Periplaneta americana TaxID=6978 RepID=A0ABQ8SUI6_PERAM|nr:hypothetical protein ANN_13798 [Periplaneta americana]
MRLNANRWTRILTTWVPRIGKRNAGRQKTRTDRLDTATFTPTLLSTDVHIRTDHVRYTLRYLHCYSVVSCPHPSDSALNGIISPTCTRCFLGERLSKNEIIVPLRDTKKRYVFSDSAHMKP